MAVKDDLETIGEQAKRELDRVHDFLEHSKIVWRSFKILVDEGHRVQAENIETGSRIDQDDLVRLAPLYTRDYLATFTFRQFVSAFEVFLFNFLHRLLIHNPWQFSKSAMTFGIVLEAATRDEIISEMILRQLNDLRYERLGEWFVSLNKAVKLDCPSDEEIERLAEIKAARDILEHNAGVVNETYRKKAGSKARYAVGDHIEIDDSYHLESWRLIKKVVADMTAAAKNKL
jgi:hypothetical protein